MKSPLYKKLVLCFFLLPVMSVGGQFIEPLPEKIYDEFRQYDFPMNDAKLRFKAFRPEYFYQLKDENLSSFKSLEYPFILIEAPPMAQDHEKEKVLKLFEKNMHCLKEFYKCPRLKGLAFKISSYILIKSSDAGLSYRGQTRETRKKANALNLRRFNERFGPKLKKLLPGIKLYSRNDYW